jgi:two-component system cell cycle sensor histidine kinase/response regulator CckA
MNTNPTATAMPSVGGKQLVQLEGARIGRTFRLGDTTLLGRGAAADVQLVDELISRRHARIHRDESGRHVIEDLESANGTFVNEVPVRTQVLQLGDYIRLGTRTVLIVVGQDPLHDELLQQRRLEELGRMGVGIAHDLNNMLGAICSTLDFMADLSDDTPLGEAQVRECLRDLRLAANQAGELTGMLIGFVRGEQAGQGEVDLSGVCSRVVRMLGHVLDRSIVIEYPPGPAGVVVLGRQAELMQLVLNLCLNARDAMPDGGRLTVTVDRTRPTPTASEPTAEARVMVADTGRGMDTQTVEHVFEPFYTTKGRAGSLGFGLAIANAVARGHGGRIEVESRPESGSVFTVHLPLCQERRSNQPAQTLRPPLKGPAPEERRRVLVVDDESVVRRSLRRLLERAGYDVLEANNGVEAIKIYRSSARKPAVVLLDLDMPEMGGLEAARLLAEQDAEVKVVFISGHLDHSRDVVPAGARVLAKPCEARELLDRVAAAIAAGTDFEEITTRVSVAPAARHKD